MLDQEIGLPVRYRDDRLQVLALDPHRCWVYWDEGEAIARLAAAYLPPEWKTAPRQLRVRAASGEERLVECPAEAGSAYVEALPAGARCRVEYGVTVEGRFLAFLSQQVQLPGRVSAALPSREKAECISSYSLYQQV